MQELMVEFIEKKDLNVRIQIKQRMKALLDLMSTDTVYPDIKDMSKKKDDRPRGAPYAAGNIGEPISMQVGASNDGPRRRGAEVDDHVASPVPIPGAEVAMDNEDLVTG